MTKRPDNLDLPTLLANQRLLLIGGKGGVGKTTVASALALAAAGNGRRVLLVSTDPAHSLADAFDQSIGDTPTPLATNLSALEIDPDREVDSHLARVASQMRQYASAQQWPQLERQLQLSAASPGAQEAALLERICTLIADQQDDYDLIIMDTAPTGHTLRLLTLPEMMATWTDGLIQQRQHSDKLQQVLKHLAPGRELDSPLQDPSQASPQLGEREQALLASLQRRQRLFFRTRRLLSDPTHSQFLFVLTPERLPILETRRAVTALQSQNIPVAGAIINRVLPEEPGNGFLQARQQRQHKHLQTAQQALAELPLQQLYLQEEDIQGKVALTALGKALQLT